MIASNDRLRLSVPTICMFAAMGLLNLLADDTPSLAGNLIQNPSFENPSDSSGWKQNNWAKNDAEFALDPDNPHSGKQSQRIVLRHGVAGKTDVQLVYQGMDLQSGAHLEFRFWTRGVTTGTWLTISLGTNYAPFKKYFTDTVKINPSWTESVFQITLPSEVDSKNNALIFELKDETTVWLDDVSLTPAPASPAVP